MERQTNDELSAITPSQHLSPTPSIGTVIDHWDCPCCDRTIAVIRRPGRPRLYCSQACRQRAYRWRSRHGIHTTSVPSWPAESASVANGKHQHALRTDRDPLADRRDARGREATVCGVLAEPKRRPSDRRSRAPFLTGTPSTCRTCEALTVPRPLGLLPPGATPPPRVRSRDDMSAVTALRAIRADYPLDPRLRHMLQTSWAA